MLGGRLLHGGDYNPDQWLAYPEIFEEDVRLMKEANVNCVSLGIFAWASLEPEEGRYEFDWLDHIITRLGEEDIQVVLATPSGAMPHWLTQKYPEVMQVQADGRRNLPGKRHNFCYTSPVMRTKTAAIDRELARRFGKRKNVILWHISNELGGNFGDSTCHCELCQEAFREWLKKKYKTLENLNNAWWNHFWSHTYTDWSQIHSPGPYGETTSTALVLDWRRFSTEQISDFCEMEIRTVKEESDIPATTNFMDFFKGLDYNRLKKGLDIISWDSYPFWHEQKDEVPAAVRTAANHSVMRALKKAPFLLMESTPSAISWRNSNPLKRPGMHMLASMQAIAHGSDSVQYFQWRKGRGGYEKFHGALLDSSGCETRTIREARTLGNKLTALKDVIGTVNKPVAGIIRDTESRWAMEGSAGPRNKGLHYRDNLRRVYLGLRSSGLDADVIGPEHDFSAYRILVVPMLYMFRAGLAERLESFTADGGILVVTHWSGVVDEYDSIYPGKTPYGLSEVLGLRRAEIDALQDGVENVTIPVAGNGLGLRKNYTCSVLSEIPEVYSAEPILLYGNDFYKGLPVVTEHDYKKGRSYYIASMMEEDFYHDLFSSLIEKNGIESIAKALPRGVFASERIGNGKRYIFLQNFSGNDVLLSSSLLNGKRIIGDGDILKPYDTFVFER